MPFKSYTSSLKDRFGRKTKVNAETTTEVVNGAFGGVRARITPTNVNPVFTRQPRGGGGITGGLTARIADRPNSAPMLNSADWHTNVPGIGILRSMPTIPFRRGTDLIHPAAVTDATHIRDTIGVHPTVRRKVLRGHESL